MKKILLAISFIVAGFTYSRAQEIVLEDVSSGFQGIYPVMDGQAFYTFYKTEKQGSKTATLNLLSYTRELNLNKKTTLEIPSTSNVVASALSMNTYFVILGDADKKTLTRIAVDENGKIIKKTEEKVSSDALMPGNAPKVITAMPEGFVVITAATENKRKGYKLERFDKNMDAKWTKTFAPESGSWTAVNVYPIMERIVVIRKETTNDGISYAIHTIQGDQGESMLTSSLKEGEEIAIPTVYKTKDDLGVVGGLLYDDKKATHPSGIFGVALGPAGDLQKSARISFSRLADSLKNSTMSSIAEGKMGLFVDDILKAPGGYTIICEAYNRVTTGKETHFITRDFIFIELNEEAEFKSARVQPKTPKEAIVKGSLSDMNDFELAQWLSANHFFSYRLGTHMRQPAIVYQTDDTAASLQVLSIRDTSRRSAPAVTMNRIKMKPSSFIFDNTSKTEDYMKFPYAYATQGTREMMLIYQYSKPKLVIWMHPSLLQ